MVHLLKLQLRGIRSYNPNTINTIDFHSPLTLIVGANGSGKTTIIETLKYITCNELPQNTRGGAFIYDPKLLSTYETKANIKLTFVNIDNNHMTIQRSLQGIQKKTGLTHKSLETNLSLMKNDQIINVSNKLSSIDVQMEHFLGVSNALLQSIIFCHQEESNWFLSEPVNVKKKFDEIFNTTKYSKALDNIKSVRREIGAKTKMKVQELEYLLERKMKKERIKVASYEHKQRLENINAELSNLRNMGYENEIMQLKLAIDKEKENEDEYNRIIAEIKMYEQICKSGPTNEEFIAYVVKIKEIENRHKRFFVCNDLSFLGVNDSNVEFDFDSAILYAKDFDFKNKSQIFEKMIFDCKATIEKHKIKADIIRNKMVESEQKYSNIVLSAKKIAKYEKEIDDAKNKICNLVQIKQYNDSLEFPNNIYENESAEVYRDSIEKLESQITEENGHLIEINYELNEKENQKVHNQKHLGDLREVIQKYTDQVNSIKLEHDEITKVSETEEELDENKKLACQKLNEYEKTYYSAFSNNEKYNEQNSIMRQKDHLWIKITKESENIIATLSSFINSVDTNKVVKHNLLLLITLVKNPIDIKEIITNWESTKNVLFDFCNSRLLAFERNKNERDSFLDKLKQLQSINEAMTMRDLYDYKTKGETIDELDKRLRDKENTMSISQNATILFENFQKKGLQRNMCYLCRRKLTIEEKEMYTHSIDKILTSLKIKTDSCVQEHSKILQSRNEIEISKNYKVEDICFTIEKYLDEKVKDKITNMKIDEFIEYIESKTEITNCTDFMDMKKKLYEVKHAMRCLQNNVNEYNELEIDDSYSYVDIIEIKEHIDQYKKKIESIENKIDIIRKNTNTDSTHKTKISLINEIERHKLALHEKEIENENLYEQIMKIQSDLNETTMRLMRRKDELKIKIEAYERLKQKIQSKKDEFNKYKYIIQQNNEWIIFELNLHDLSNEYDKENRIKDQKTTITQSINDLEPKLLRMKDHYEDLLEQIQESNVDLEIYHNDYSELKKNTDNIRNHLQHFENGKKLNQLRNKLTKVDYEHIKTLRKELQHLETLQNKNNIDVSMLIGEQKQINIQYNRIIAEISNDYSDAEDKYIECYIEVKTLEYIIDDVDRCIKALDKSIVEFYSTKIDEINTILKELWVSTYKGNDIEYIMLKSETSDNKVYNYRMVMYKNGIELDLRGRSSAGQKMLISILTRLAICDAFCGAFNVLALDEPTTNLDKENIESLAFTLQKIIDSRKMSNFQLIIITHDESFLETMNRNGCDEYYRVYKDSCGNSMITKESIYFKG